MYKHDAKQPDKLIKVTVEGKPGAGKTWFAETLRAAGWYVSAEEKLEGDKVQFYVNAPDREMSEKGK